MSSIGKKLLFRLSKNSYLEFLRQRLKRKSLTSMIIFLSLILLFTGPVYTANADGNTTIESFSKAKKILMRQVLQNHRLAGIN